MMQEIISAVAEAVFISTLPIVAIAITLMMGKK